jgi:hypothetical protein
MSDFLIGALVSLLGLLGLYAAGHALDSGMETFGLGLAFFAVFYVVWLVKKHFDRASPAA